MMDKLEGIKHTGQFRIATDKDVHGELTLSGSKTSLYLHDRDFFDAYPRPGRCVTGVLLDLRKVTLIDCVTMSGTGTGSRGGERYHFANLFPHFALFGDHHIAPDQPIITAVDFVIDDAGTLFYDFDAFGSVIDARPYIEQIAHANRIDRAIRTGPDPQIVYFTGKREIFSADTVLGRISATHNPSHAIGGPGGVCLEDTIFVTMAFKEPLIFDEAMTRTATVNSYLGMLVGRPQNIVELAVRLATVSETPAHLRVYWSMPPRRDATREEERPHPADVLLDAVRQPDSFSNVLASWLQAHSERQEARGRFFGCFGDQQYYSTDRLVAAANMFDILPSSALPVDVALSAEEQKAREAARQLFRALPQSIERDAVLGVLGRMGKSNLKRKIRHRAKLVLDTVGGRFPDLEIVCDEAVNCRNYYVHGSDPVFDYSANAAATHFFTDTLEFIFAASDLIEAGWDVKEWIARGSTMSNPFARYRVNYGFALGQLKALLPARCSGRLCNQEAGKDMPTWVFGYGSLMWDGWETNYGCMRKTLATLDGYRRTFNKASTKNRGTKEAPCPTLNLEQHASGTCTGMAFEFPQERSKDMLAYLAQREGKDFELENITVRLQDGVDVQAKMPLYKGVNVISGVTLQQKAAMVCRAAGSKSSGVEYVREIARLLARLNIDDAAVKELWHEVQKQSACEGNGK